MNEYAAEVERINGNVASTYSALSEMGVTMPAQQNSDNLPGTVRTVPQGGGKTVQTDWNQTDETAPDFLKNKPLYDYRVETVIIEEGEYIVEDGMALLSDNAIGLNLGQVYTVYFDNMVYQIIPVVQPEGILIGDMNFTTYPFVITAIEGFGTVAIFLDDLPHKVKIACRAGDMKQIDNSLVSAEWMATSLEHEDIIVPVSSYDFSDGSEIFEIERDYNIAKKVINDTMSLKLTLNGVEYKNVLWAVYTPGDGIAQLVADSNTYILFENNKINIQAYSPITDFGLSFIDKIPREMPAEYLPNVPSEKFVLTSPGGKQFVITVDDSGTLTATEVTV